MALPVAAAAPAKLRPALTATLKGPKKPGSKAEAAFQLGLAALSQWAEREGRRPIPHGAVVEVLIDGETVPVRLRVWLSNTKSRRNKLTAQQLAALSMKWAGPASATEANAPGPPAAHPTPPAAPAKRRALECHAE
ncbi:hypothetical protein [Streptomyces sp. SID2563]|uniref:hypothetical protein n=1 Tax=Streptomyces sp. SID2563 TaxID=2690255 RepID=UPI001F382FC2|nr:hypothetical protein [Streptomyces sp. SID2563]